MIFENKKLVVVIWNLGIGGMQKRLTDVAEQMSRKNPNWQIFFWVKYKTKSPFEKRLIGLKNVSINYFSDSKAEANSIIFWYWLIKKWRIIRPDVCLTFLDYLSISCLLIRWFFSPETKIILNESMLTSTYVEMQRGWRQGWIKMMIKWLYPKADKIIVPTKREKFDLVKNFKISLTKISVLPNWTNWPSRKQPTEKDIDLLFVGRIDKEKGIDNLFGIWPEIKKRKWKLAIVGAGREEKNYKKRFGKEVLWAGMSGDIKKWMDRAKILVLPTKNEGMPNVVLEAGIRGVPTISNNFGGVEELVKNNYDGVVVNSREQMVGEISRLLSDQRRLSLMGIRISQKIKARFGIKNQERFIESLIS